MRDIRAEHLSPVLVNVKNMSTHHQPLGAPSKQILCTRLITRLQAVVDLTTRTGSSGSHFWLVQDIRPDLRLPYNFVVAGAGKTRVDSPVRAGNVLTIACEEPISPLFWLVTGPLEISTKYKESK